MPTGKQAREAVGRYLNRLQDDPTTPVFREIINSGTSLSAFLDATRLLSTRFTSQTFNDWWLLITSGARWGDLSFGRQLTATLGSLAVSPPFSGALANGNTGELWSPKTPGPDRVNEARDWALAHELLRSRMVPLTWAEDGDMLAADESAWTTSNATDAKGEDSGLERFVEQMMTVVLTSAGGFTGQTIRAPEAADTLGRSKTWFVHVLVQAVAGAALLVVRDTQNGADLTLSGNRSRWDGQAYATMRNTFTAPASAETLQVRLGGVATGATLNYANLCIYPVGAQDFVLPARITTKARVGRFYEIIGDEWPDMRFEPLREQPRLFDVGGGGVRAVFPHPIGARPVYYEEHTHYAALQSDYHTSAQRAAGDAASTDAKLDTLMFATLEQLFPGRFREQVARLRAEDGPRRRVRVNHGGMIRA